MQHEQLPIVLIPGFMLDETMWDEFITTYPDNRCFIRASLSHGENIAAMARQIADRLPERFVLAGFSLGGYVARAIAQAFPSRTAGLILIATSLREDTPEQRARLEAASRAALSADFKGISPGTVKRSLHPSRHGDVALIQKVREMGKRLGAEVFRAQSGLDRNGITLRPMSIPVMVVAAGQDQIRSDEEAAELASHFGCEVDFIEGTGHLIPLEKPLELARSVYKWLQTSGL